MSLPLYGLQPVLPAPTGWTGYEPLNQTATYSSGDGSFFLSIHSHGLLPGLAQGWYWTVAATAGFLLTLWWYRRPSSRPGNGVAAPGTRYLITVLAVTVLATAVPLAVAAALPIPRSGRTR